MKGKTFLPTSKPLKRRTTAVEQALTRFFAKPLDQLSSELWVVLLDQVVDRFLFDG